MYIDIYIYIYTYWAVQRLLRMHLKSTSTYLVHKFFTKEVTLPRRESYIIFPRMAMTQPPFNWILSYINRHHACSDLDASADSSTTKGSNKQTNTPIGHVGRSPYP